MTRAQHGHFNIIHVDSGLKADFFLAGDELHTWAFQRANHYTIGETRISLAPPEYVFIRKLEYYREGSLEKHLRDIRSMLAVSEGLLDKPVLKHWIERRGLEAEWQRVVS
jgi:hypothetical protein